jgi:hypothetical protein
MLALIPELHLNNSISKHLSPLYLQAVATRTRQKIVRQSSSRVRSNKHPYSKMNAQNLNTPVVRVEKIASQDTRNPDVCVTSMSSHNATNQEDEEGGVGTLISNTLDIRQTLTSIGLHTHPLVYKLIQEFLTWSTGKPYPGQTPSLKVGKIYQLVTGLLSLTLGIVGSFLVINFSLALPLLVITWAYTVGGARKLQTTICHHCTHYKFWGDKRDKWLAECLSTILLTQDFHAYFEEHVKQHHDIRKFANHQFDPDLQLLYLLGFCPNLIKLNIDRADSIDETKPYWRHLWLTFFSPKLHLIFLEARFKANFLNPSIYRWIMSVAWIAALTSIVILTRSLPQFFWAVLFPLTFLYHIASLLQFLSEHNWWSKNLDPSSKSHGRFCGVAPPSESSILAWCRWTYYMFLNFLVRLTVLNGDLPQHDWHHRSPKTQQEWANSTYARQREVEVGINYTEFWSLSDVIEHVFQGLAKANSD